ncbi:MAG: LysE family translocator [Chloroflexota bacterium]|nr:LysE family translocator [Chloroflexota bacterium]
MATLPAFAVIALLLIVTPGPDMALVMRNALAHGRRAALVTAFGCVVGLLVWTAASVIGLAALLATSTEAFTVVKWLGAAYLVYLGARTLLELRRPEAGPDAESSPRRHGFVWGGSPFRQGVVSNLLNPKIAVLFTSLIPQFVTPGPSATFESVVLAGLFIGLGLAWLSAFAVAASAAAGLFRRRRVKQFMNAITGVVLVGLGLRLATEPAKG